MELKPCPFCGSKEELTEQSVEGHLYYIRCNSCDTEGPTRDGLKEARRIWNTRPGELPRRAAPEPAPIDRVSQGAFIDDPIREGPPMDLFKRACDWIENIDIQYGPSPHSLAAEFAEVRAEERERCARVCEEVENEKKGIGSKVAWDFGHGAGIAAAAIRKGEP